MPRLPEGWKQFNFRAPAWWRKAAEAYKTQCEQRGEMIDYEEAVRRLYRLGAETAGVWQEEGD